jgi:excinuclease ABC subunit C
MKTLAKDHYFEEAAVIRNQIKNLKHIQDIALITSTEVHNDQSPITSHQFTIEGYDISNLGKSGKVGGLVAFNQHGPIKSGYKKFKIKTVVGQSDVDCLREVLSRRLKHEDWPWPDYFLIDGGKPQLRAAVETLQKYNCHRPVIGIAKGADRRKNEFILASREPEVIAFVTNHKHTLIQARDEAHRFAITYQKQLRKIK